MLPPSQAQGSFRKSMTQFHNLSAFHKFIEPCLNVFVQEEVKHAVGEGMSSKVDYTCSHYSDHHEGGQRL